MDFKDLYMWERDVFSEGKLCMDLMLWLRKNPLARLVIAGRNGVVCVVVQGRTKAKRCRSKNIELKNKERHPPKFMRLKQLKREWKVDFLINYFVESLIEVCYSESHTFSFFLWLKFKLRFAFFLL